MKNKLCIRRIINIWTILVSVSFFVCMMFYFGYDYVTKNKNVYLDFLIGEDTYCETNKVGEWHVFWFVLFMALALAAILSFLESQKSDNTAYLTKTYFINKEWFFYAILSFFPFFTHLIIYQTVNYKFLLISFLCSMVVYFLRENSMSYIAFFLILYFFIEVMAVIGSVFFQRTFFTDANVLAGTVILFVLCLSLTGFVKKITIRSIGDFIQIFIPGLFLLYLKDTYQSGTGPENMYFPMAYKMIISFIVFVLSVASFVKFYNAYLRKDPVIYQEPVNFSTVISAFSFVSYMSPAMILPFDLHHHGEQILPWQQIVELGQKAYEEYSPASGLFPMILGCINRYVFHGMANAYNMSFVLFAFLFEFVTMYLLYRKVGGRWALCFAMVFHMPVYCRVWIIFPTLLLWSDKKLIENKTLWLISYIFVSFLDGLFYPLYGAALLLGALPFAFLQVASFIKTPDMKRKYIPVIVFVLAVIGASLPLLERMFEHVMSMSGQTLAVDGINIYQSDVPDWFMPYFSNYMCYSMIYYIVRLSLGIIVLVPVVYLLCHFLKCRRKCFDNYRTDAFFMLSCIVPTTCICYTYTMVCMDEDWVSNLLSRSSFVVSILCSAFFLVYLICHGKEMLNKKNYAVLLALTLSIPFLFFEKCSDYQFPPLEGTTDQDSFVLGEYQSKLRPYAFKDGYVRVTDEIKAAYPDVDFERIGNGYVSLNVLEKLDKLEVTMDYLRLFDPDIRLLGFEQSQFFYYLLNEKAVYSGRTAIARSYDAVTKEISLIDTEKTVVRTGVIPLEEYYLYRYLVEKGYYYSEDLDLFLPHKLYAAIYGKKGNYDSSAWTADYNCYGVAAAFADSVNSMEHLHSRYRDIGFETETVTDDKDICFVIKTEQPVEGNQADFIYVDINGVSGGSVKIYFNCLSGDKAECSMTAWVDDGKLLFPIGTNPNWLLDGHDQITLELTGSTVTGNVDVSDIGFYKLDELPQSLISDPGGTEK